MRSTLGSLALALVATGCAALPGGLPEAGRPDQAQGDRPQATQASAPAAPEMKVDLGFLSGVTLVTSTSSVAEPIGSAASL
ncbi:MAG: hypothetical protein FJZ01_08115 [Candidatus Sericytochromatia bacterium]|nr:hypothetical protein [Candidatus Tanganyikabacteria bacterium]